MVPSSATWRPIRSRASSSAPSPRSATSAACAWSPNGWTTRACCRCCASAASTWPRASPCTGRNGWCSSAIPCVRQAEPRPRPDHRHGQSCRPLATMPAGWMLAFAAGASTATVDLEPYLRRDSYERVKISPDGAYFAITVPMEDRTVLAVVRRNDLQPTAKVAGGVGSEVDDFWWANNERVVVSMAHRYGSRDEPGVIGELHAVNADGSYAKLLASPYGLQESNPLVSHLRYELEGSVFMLDPMPTERNFILVQSVAQTSDPVSQIERLDLYTRRRTHLASAPLPYASLPTEVDGQLRSAHGVGRDNSNKLYCREDDKAKWRLVHDEATAKVRAFARGFTADGRLAYLQMEHRQGPDSLGTWDPETGEYTELLRDEVVEPLHIIHDLDGRTPDRKSV